MSKFVTIVRNSIIIASAVAASVPAFAGTVETAPVIAVSYADLNLSSAEGQSRLHHRLTAAAESVCEGTLQPGSKIQADYSACVSKAMTAANTEFAALTTKSPTRVAVR